MSDNVPAEKPTSDLTALDLAKIERFVANGSPGFNLSDEAKITQMMDLYLSGKTYSQIARITRCPKELVMVYSQRLNWYPLKLEYQEELMNSMRGRIVAAKMQSQDFLLQLSQMWQKKIGKKMDQYMSTGDESHADSISLKEIDKYLKTLETLNKLTAEGGPKGDKPLVGVNVGDGVSITKQQDGSVEITPKAKTIGSMLETLANQRREAEAAKQVKTSDIKDVTPDKDKTKE